MDFYSPWPPVVILVALFGLVATPLFRLADSPPITVGNRISTLDGLRGFLAFAVFFHHAAIFHMFGQGKPWAPPPSRLYALLGPYGVAMFFMITGFLFWGQLMDKDGKPGWVKLYMGRLFRLGPLYLFAITMLAIFALGAERFGLRESPARVASEYLQWALSFGFRMGPPIDAYPATRDLISVVWSLRYEWIFYGSLLITGVFTRSRMAAWAFPALGLGCSLLLMMMPIVPALTGQAQYAALFSVGMLTAGLKPLLADRKVDHPMFSVLAGALLIAVLCLFDTAYKALPICLLGVAFLLIANGVSLFGLLNTRSARRLGNISYGLYLLQLLILAVAFEFPGFHHLAAGSPFGHWAITAGAALALTIISTGAHALIERPGVELGRLLIQRLVGRRLPVRGA